jgi:hypothetical protein
LSKSCRSYGRPFPKNLHFIASVHWLYMRLGLSIGSHMCHGVYPSSCRARYKARESVNQVPDDRKRTYTLFQCAKALRQPASRGSRARMVVLYRSDGSWLGFDESLLLGEVGKGGVSSK